MIEYRSSQDRPHDTDASADSKPTAWDSYATRHTNETNVERRRAWTEKEFQQLSLPEQLGILARALLQLAAERISAMPTRNKLAVAALPLSVAGGLGLWYGNTPHELASTTVGIEAGDGGIQTTCDATAALAEELGLDPNNGDNCVYAGQDANKELALKHPSKAIQPGEKILVTLTQTPLEKMTGAYTVKASAAKQ